MGDYDHDPKEKKGVYLRLKNKDESIVIRLASKPYREPKVWRDNKPIDSTEVSLWLPADWYEAYKNPEMEVKEAYHWLVIDRSDGEARVFTATPSVYKAIKELALKPQWGDPRGYDIEVTRTEDPGKNYYKVVSFPDKTPLMQSEIDRIKKLDIDQLIPNARPANQEEAQIDNIEGYVAGLINEQQAQMDGAGNDPVYPVSDQPVNLDDIPY